MSALDVAKKGAAIGVVAIEALDHLVKLVNVGGPASSVLEGVEAALEAFASGVASGATAEEISADLAKLAAGLASNDAAANAAVDKKFPR